MTNKLTFEANTASNTIEDIRDMRNIGEYNGDYYWASIGAGSEYGDTLYLYKAPDFTTTPTLVHSFGFNGAIPYATTTGKILVRVFRDEVYVAGAFSYFNGVTSKYEYTLLMFNSQDLDQVTPTWYENSRSNGLSTTAGQQFVPIDFLDWNSATLTPVWIVLQGGGTTETTIYCTTTQTSVNETSFTIAANNKFYNGYLDDNDDYWFLYEDASNNWRKGRFYQSTFAFDAGQLYEEWTLPTTYDISKQQYIVQFSKDIIIDPYHIQLSNDDGGIFSKYTADSPTTAVCLIYGEEVNKDINYIVWDENVWKLTQGGSIENIQAHTGAAYVGYDTWFSDGDDIWLETFTYANITSGDVTHRVMDYPLATIRSPDQPFTNQWLELYNSSDTLIYQGRVVKDRNNGTEYIYTMISGIEEDFAIKITESFTSKTIKEMTEFIIDKYFNHIWYGTNISNTNTDTFTKSFSGIGFKDFLKWAAQYGGYICSFTPDYEIRLGPFLSSGESIDENATTYAYLEKSFETFHEKFSLVRIYGAYVNGVQLMSEVQGEPNYGYWQDEFATANTQVELDNLADQILSDRNVVITAATFEVANKDYLQVGEDFTYTSYRRSITAESWYFSTNVISFLNESQSIYATDSFWMPTVSKEEKTNDRITQNEQHIGALEDKVEGIVVGGGFLPTDGTGKMDNDAWLKWRNAADSADINVLKVDGSNLTQFGTNLNLGTNGIGNDNPILTFAAGAAGKASFNGQVALRDNYQILLGNAGDMIIVHDGVDSTIQNQTGDLNITADTGDIVLDPSGNIQFEGNLVGASGTGDVKLDTNLDLNNNVISDSQGTLVLADDVQIQGSLDMAANSITSTDGDYKHIFGRAAIGYATGETVDRAYFGHRDQMGIVNSYALLQTETGETQLNCKTGTDLKFTLGSGIVGMYDSSIATWDWKGKIMDNMGASSVNFDAFNAIGSANAQYSQCSISARTTNGAGTIIGYTFYSDIDHYGMTDTYGTDFVVMPIHLPPTKGALNLYIKGIRWIIYDADATNRCKVITLRGYSGTTLTALGTYAPDITTTGVKNIAWDGGDANCGSYTNLYLEFNIFQVVSRSFEFSLAEVEYYYA
jgi:hypothetical protein